MSEWTISIVGVIMLGVLLEIILPEGKTAKYVRGAFSLLVVFAIAAPLPALLGKELKVSLDTDAARVDEAYVAGTYAAYADRLSTAVEEYLENEGFDADVSVEISEGRIARVDIALWSGDAQAARETVAKRLNMDVALIAAHSVREV